MINMFVSVCALKITNTHREYQFARPVKCCLKRWFLFYSEKSYNCKSQTSCTHIHRAGVAFRCYDRGYRKHLTVSFRNPYRKVLFCIINYFTCRICCFQSCMHISETSCGKIYYVLRCLRCLYLTKGSGRVKSGLLRGRLIDNFG